MSNTLIIILKHHCHMKSTLLILFVCLTPLMGAAQTQLEMTQEAIKEYEKSDLEMTRIFKKVMTRFETAEHKKKMLEAQRAWIKYKEAHCKSFEYEWEGGTIAPMMYYACLADITKERTEKLRKYLER